MKFILGLLVRFYTEIDCYTMIEQVYISKVFIPLVTPNNNVITHSVLLFYFLRYFYQYNNISYGPAVVYIIWKYLGLNNVNTNISFKFINQIHCNKKKIIIDEFVRSDVHKFFLIKLNLNLKSNFTGGIIFFLGKFRFVKKNSFFIYLIKLIDCSNRHINMIRKSGKIF